MGVDLRALCALVPQEVLYVPQVGSLFQEMGGERMSQGVHRNPFLDPSFFYRVAQNIMDARRGVLFPIGALK